MAELREITVEFIVDPPLLARYETEGEGLDELIADIDKNGLLQPIGVTDLGTGWFELRWGKRRTLAFRAMGRRMIPAVVHAIGEGDALDQMASENFQRTQMSEPEQCKFFIEYMKEKNIDARECSRRLHVSLYRVEQALIVSAAHPDVLAAFREGRIKLPVAVELAEVTSPIHAQNMLNAAIHRQLSAKAIRIWWEQVKMDGVDVAVQEVEQIIRQNPGINYSNMQQCIFCSNFFTYEHAHVYSICHEDYDVLREIYAGYREIQQAKEKEAQNDSTGPGNGSGPTPGTGADYYGLADRP